MRRFRSSAIALSIALAILVPATRALAGPNPNTILVRDTSQGCFHGIKVVREFKEVNGYFVHDKVRIDSAWVERLKATLLSSKVEAGGLLRSLGITPEDVRLHAEDVLIASLLNTPEVPRVIPDRLAFLFDYEHISKVAREVAEGPRESTTRVLFEVTIAGSPTITVRSDHRQAWMLPWTIEVDGKEWETFDTEIPRLLSKLADSKGPNARYLDGNLYWSDEFWKDTDVWEYAIGDSLNAAHAQTLYESLTEYDAARSLFLVEEARIGAKSLNFELRTVHPHLIDAVRWWNPLKNGRPSYDWDAIHRLHNEANKACEKYPWLAQWKADGPGRSIELQAVGTRGYEDSNYSDEVLPDWEEAGLKEQPEFELLLRRTPRSWGQVFASHKADRILITQLEAGEGTHWLDRLSVEAPDFLTIDAAGRISRFPAEE